MKDRLLGRMVIAAIMILSILAIPTVSLADYDGGDPHKSMTTTTTTTQSSTTGTMSVMATPEFSGSVDLVLFVAIASLVLLLRRTTNHAT